MMEIAMRNGIHPDSKQADISCACGQVIKTRSTAGSYSVDICSACHPFYTGKQKLVDAEGRVERFRRRYSKAAS
jgi:large subunit ribosomal protein L31